jgi:hypothetical protein
MHVIGIPQGFLFAHQSELQFWNMLPQDIDALLHYYSINCYSSFFTPTPSKYAEPVSVPGNCLDMA